MKGARFVVWAPNAKEVRIIGDFNGWQGHDHIMGRIEDSGIWGLFVEGIEEGAHYKYEIYAQDGRVLHKSDPYAVYSELRPNTASNC